MRRYRIGIIGLGKMGSRHFAALREHPRWEIAWVCDRDPDRLAWAREAIPGLLAGDDAAPLMRQPDLDAVGVLTLADARPGLIRAALAHGLHVLAEKPLGATIEDEEALLGEIEASRSLVAVNLFNRNTWYHRAMREFIASGQIGQLAILDIAHLTPDLLPTEGHQPEGPPFHDCGMHYVDLARWYAESEYADWHAQGLRIWAWPDPWWVDAHGSFQNGVVFSVTQGFCYGQGAETVPTRSGLEAIGTLGVVRMRHDFREVIVEYHGVSHTETKRGPYGGKKLDVLADQLAASIDAGRNVGFPTARDSVIASRVSQSMLDFAREHAAPIVGTPDDLARVVGHKAALRAAGRAFPEGVLESAAVAER
jgi:myo-inositol 2-dehydrogenase/D-chiro-inositol 1-dehydrogenase